MTNCIVFCLCWARIKNGNACTSQRGPANNMEWHVPVSAHKSTPHDNSSHQPAVRYSSAATKNSSLGECRQLCQQHLSLVQSPQNSSVLNYSSLRNASKEPLQTNPIDLLSSHLSVVLFSASAIPVAHHSHEGKERNSKMNLVAQLLHAFSSTTRRSNRPRK